MSVPKKLLNSNKLNLTNNKKLYAQALKINIEDIINISNMFLTLLPKKIIEVNNVINKSNMVKPKIKMTSKRPLRKQVIILMSQENANTIRSNSNFHINDINRYLKDANSKILTDFIYIDKVSIIMTTNSTASAQDMRTIKNAIKNSDKINKNSVENPYLL